MALGTRLAGRLLEIKKGPQARKADGTGERGNGFFDVCAMHPGYADDRKLSGQLMPWRHESNDMNAIAESVSSAHNAFQCGACRSFSGDRDVRD